MSTKGWPEKMNRENKAAVADEIRIGTTTGSGMSTSKISSAKMTPAIGALKMAEIPAAAPQASRRILSFVPKPNLRRRGARCKPGYMQYSA